MIGRIRHPFRRRNPTMSKKMIPLFLMCLLLPLLAACGGAADTPTAVPAPTATAAAAAAPTNTEAVAAPTQAGGATGAATVAAGPTSTKGMTFALVPKNLGNPYFDTANKGAQSAADELGIKVTYTGPATADATQQIQLLNSLVAQHVAGLAISADDSDALVAT